MKRFSFFLAVFSVGLLLFLLLTGQLGKLFPGARDDSEIDRVPAGSATGTGEKRFTYHKHDYDRGRLQFTLEGTIEGESELLMGKQDVTQPRVFRDATVELPLYPPGENEATPEDVFHLDAERVRYIPRQEGAEDRVQLEGKIHGEGRTGHPVFDTEEVLLSWIGGGESARLTGERPVRIEYPAVTLRGQKGFEAHVDGREGLSDIRIHPPLVVALSADSEGSILGFQGGALFQNETGGEDSSRVHLFSRGPMSIDTANGAAVFEGETLIYQVPADTTLHPPGPDDLPAQRFRCERLRLELDSRTRRVTRLIAERVDEPVEVLLAEGYRVEGDELIWSDGEQEAVLRGNVRIIGEIGTFRAGLARIHPDEGVCWLVDGIEANVQGGALAGPGDGDEWDQRVGGEWILIGDRAEIRYARGPRGQELELFRALAAPGERVTIREDREGGALLLGGEMLYDPSLGVIRVIGGDQEGALRPDFREGRNRVESDRIDLSLVRPQLTFEGRVDADLYDPPVDAAGSWPKWLEPGEGTRTRLDAGRVRLAWDDQDRLRRLEAWEGESPLVLVHESGESFRLTANAVDWDGEEGRIRAFGEGRQELVFLDRAELTAREVNFSVARWVARGDGEVHLAAIRPAPRDAAGPAPRPVTIDGDHVEVRLRPPGDEPPAEPPPRPGDEARENPLRSGEVLGARGWSDTPGTLEIEEGSFRGVGDELVWDSLEGVIRLEGEGRQRVFYRGPDGPDEITAESLVYRSVDRRLVLEGETKGRIHQGSIPSEEASDADDSSLGWDVTAGTFEAFFREGRAEEEFVELERIVAGGGVVLTQAESEIEFRGDTAEWDVGTQRLRVFSPKGQGIQTLYRGTDQRDELVAREILLVHPAAEGRRASQRLEVLFIDVLNALIHIDQDPDRDASAPNAFTMRADNLLLGLSGTKERLAPGVSPMPIDEARAWGHVDFNGGDYRIYSHRAMFRRRTKTLHFQGQGRQKVQILLQGQATLPASNEMELRWRPGAGYEINDRPAGGQWSARQIEETLELFDRPDRNDDGDRR